MNGKPLEKWATITVNPDLVTWETSNDLCTFYRGQQIENRFEGTASPTNYGYQDPPPAIIDVIPATPTTLSGPSSCIDCCGHVVNQDYTLDQATLQPPLPIETTQIVSSEKIETVAHTESDKTGQGLRPLHLPHSLTKASTNNIPNKNVKSGENGVGIKCNEDITQNSTSVAAQNFTNYSINTTSGFTTTTTQLHLNQVCSTLVSSSPSYSSSNQQAAKPSSYPNKATLQTPRPPTPHRAASQHSRKVQASPATSQHTSQQLSSSITQPKSTKVVLPYEQKSSTTSTVSSVTTTCPPPIVSITNAKSNNNLPTNVNQALVAQQSAKIHSDNSHLQSTYPLKKRPLINIKSRPIVQVGCTSSLLISPKSKVCTAALKLYFKSSFKTCRSIE